MDQIIGVNFNTMKEFINRIRQTYEKRFNERKYWKRRMYVQEHCETGGLLAYIRLILVRRTESKFGSTTGLSIKNTCCKIESPITLYHGLTGIVIAHNVHIGKNVTILQHVTIVEDDSKKTTVIEDGVMIGAGAVIMRNVHIGKNAKIGANAVVMCDVPDNATAVGIPARIIKR